MDERVVRMVRRDGLGRRLKDVFIACYDRIIARDIVSMAEVLEFLDDLGWDPRLEGVIRRCHELIRELHWGIFRDLSPEHHPTLWTALTVTNPTRPSVADLKRNVLVPNLYCGLLDIHDYTDFCQRNRHNTSMLRILDDLIQTDMKEIARKHGCISTRTAGDAVIVIGATPRETLHACLGIIDLFSRKRVLQAANLTEDRRGATIAMQDFHVSAGIAGGLHYSSLVITQDGDVSGPVVNTAARLQAFAGTIAPDRSKVMVTSHVHAGYGKEAQADSASAGALSFFGCGRIRFKGTAVSVYELLYAEREMKKIRYQSAYDSLLKLLERRTWSDRLVPEATRLVMEVLHADPIPRVELEHHGARTVHTNESVLELCREALAGYESAQDHRLVSGRLREAAAVLEAWPAFDPLVRAHFVHIVGAYEAMTREFETLQYEKILENQNGLFSSRERTVIDHAARLERIRDILIERGKQTNNVYSPAMLWNQVVNEHDGKWEFEIYSGKR